MTTLTLLEKDVLIAIATNEYSNEPGDEVWSFSIHYNCKQTTQVQLPGVVSSLVKKGLVHHRAADTEDKSDMDTVYLTKEGIEVYKSLTVNAKKEGEN